jgi:1-aminocyclopropane-1-carboxylate deaminase/D-cysteine desulfhydrase-like pyridoxal-dependent ACC family enzyme
VSVSWAREKLTVEAERLLDETCELLQLQPPSAAEFWLDDGFVGPGYARISAAGLAAVRLTARTEGVLLDTTYTGKALAGLIALIERGSIRPCSTVVFVHTGGTPELFSHPPHELLASQDS